MSLGMLGMVKGEAAQVLTGTALVSAAGALVFGLYSASSACRSPSPAPTHSL